MRIHTRSAAFFIAAAILTVLGVPSWALGQACPSWPPLYAKGKISRNFYRVPYENGVEVNVGGDYRFHGGSMDMTAVSAPAFLVAPADGVVCAARDHLNDCGCPEDSGHLIGGCANAITILHANGESSGYLHMKQFSIRDAFGVTDPNEIIGMPVVQGQIIAIEGDVGRTCNSGGPDPRFGTCITKDQGAGLTNCGRHVHWNIRRDSTGELLRPMTCDIPFNIYSQDYPGAREVFPCAEALGCIANAVHLAPTTMDGYGNGSDNRRVVQNHDAITASAFVVRNRAAAVFHAGNKIRLLPGFKAGAGDAYFRAEIGPCSTTAPNP